MWSWGERPRESGLSPPIQVQPLFHVGIRHPMRLLGAGNRNSSHEAPSALDSEIGLEVRNLEKGRGSGRLRDLLWQLVTCSGGVCALLSPGDPVGCWPTTALLQHSGAGDGQGGGPPLLSCPERDPESASGLDFTKNESIRFSQRPSREEQRRGLGKGCPGDEPVSQIRDIEAWMH